MNWYYITAYLIILFIVELIYFKVADYYNIVDKPNHRSSHTSVTIRGGGVIFFLAIVLYSVYYSSAFPWFVAGLSVVAIISFVDDINPVSSRVRFILQLTAVMLMFAQLQMYSLPIYVTILAVFFVIGAINAVNFMDGINGISGLYGLVTLATLYYINIDSQFTNSNFLVVAFLSVLVFTFFNFRKKARCFAGDVGSVSLAFILLFFILQVILKTGEVKYVLLLMLYGLDTSTTIFFRLIRRENVMEAHRSHFYQFWANEKKVSHLLVSGSYGLSQLLINIALLSIKFNSLFTFFVIIMLCTVFCALLRLNIEGSHRLLKRHQVKKLK